MGVKLERQEFCQKYWHIFAFPVYQDSHSRNQINDYVFAKLARRRRLSNHVFMEVFKSAVVQESQLGTRQKSTLKAIKHWKGF